MSACNHPMVHSTGSHGRHDFPDFLDRAIEVQSQRAVGAGIWLGSEPNHSIVLLVIYQIFLGK
jgi:hypothetical protein